MRILSVQQPFAQLVVRGIQRIVPRGWDPGVRERIAIHASGAVASKADAEVWFHERNTARCFADQGWMDRDDLKQLPRGAIIGTVQLASVWLGADVHAGKSDLFAWTTDSGQFEASEHTPDGASLLLTRRSVRLLRVPLPADVYAWHLTDAVEIEPITDVDGLQRLWSLEGEIAGVIAHRERLARKRVWRAPQVSAARKEKARRAVRERERLERDLMLTEVERVVRQRRALLALRLAPHAEQQFHDDLVRYRKTNLIGSASAGDPQLRVEPQLRKYFGGRARVSSDEFILTIKRRIKAHADALYAARRAEARLKVLHEIIADAERESERASVRRSVVVTRLEHALDRMLEEEEEDLEFVRRELYPLSDEKAARAEARAQANEQLWADESAALARRQQARADAARAFEVLAEVWPDLAVAVAGQAALAELDDAVRRPP